MLHLHPLDQRKQQILKAVVDEYVSTAEPVGSHLIAGRHQLGVRSATIRNEMAELSEMGYLRQPHTSAGRIPSDLGYRFYVDRLMDAAVLPYAEAQRARRLLALRTAEVELLLEHTCRILADLARYTSVASQPKVKEAAVQHVSVVKVGRKKVLAVIVLDNGRVIHEILDMAQETCVFDPIKATNYLTAKLSGFEVSSLSAAPIEGDPEAPRNVTDLAKQIVQLIVNQAEAEEEVDIHFSGTSYMMQQPEFKNPERLEAVLSILDQRRALYKLFSSVMGPEVTVLIGRENPVEEMVECSFVGAKYRVGGKIAGTVGVMGPTRMDYRRAISAVESVARNLERLLNGLSAL
ncbi:MAG: heat-inducible transcriptional repressor HrcA [Armatimonadota bacterium]|nr:heat-inducible transcriptional repressor HrcA [Armatimonadota bacterium]